MKTTSLEAIRVMDLMIEAMPDTMRDGKNGFMLSKDFAQALLDYVKWSGNVNKPFFESGDEFTWKGIPCKVV